MSEQLIHTIKKQIQSLQDFLEVLMTKYLAPTTESVKRVSNLIQEQTKFIQKGFSDQIIYNLLIQISSINTKVKKASKLKKIESKRIEEKKKYLKIQVDDLLEKLEAISNKLDEELNNRVEKLDKYALDFLERSYSSDVKNYLSEFEIPALEKIKIEEEAILSARVNAIEEIVSSINAKVSEIKELDYSTLDKFSFSSDKKGAVLIKVMNVNYKKPNGETDQISFSPSRINKTNNGTKIKPLIQLN